MTITGTLQKVRNVANNLSIVVAAVSFIAMLASVYFHFALGAAIFGVSFGAFMDMLTKKEKVR